MGDTFRHRLADGTPSNVIGWPMPKAAEPGECDACRDVVRDDELFDGLCESCALALRDESDPRFEYGFVNDLRS
jgi:hypothetical protein